MRRALSIGINTYQNADPLNGCANDATRIHGLIQKNFDGSPNFESVLLTSDEMEVTTQVVRSKIDELLSKPADMALFYFSGHGAASNVGGYLCTYDARRYQEGVSMQELLSLAIQSPVKEIIIILDCCFSGAFGAIPALANGNQVTIKEGISILTASRDLESSVEINGSGVFTTLVCDALEGSAADLLGTITPSGIYSHVEQSFGAWDQRPLFKSYVSRSTPIRKSEPKVNVTFLRELPKLFENQDADYSLDPTYEETEGSAVPDHVAIFKKLKKLQVCGLIHVNDGLTDLYWAAIKKSSCKLSPLGKFYWSLAKAGKI